MRQSECTCCFGIFTLCMATFGVKDFLWVKDRCKVDAIVTLGCMFMYSFVYHRMGRWKFHLGQVPKKTMRKTQRRKGDQWADQENPVLYLLLQSVVRPPAVIIYQLVVHLRCLWRTLFYLTSSGQSRCSTQTVYVGICKLSCSSQDTISVTHSIVVSQDLSWTLTAHGKEVDPQMCSVSSGTPTTLTTATLQTLLSVLHKANICPGHPDQQFLSMLEAKKGKLLSRDGHAVMAYEDSSAPVTLNGEEYLKTARRSLCELVVNGTKCPSCVSYRNTLRKSYHRWLKQKCIIVSFN